MVREKVWALVTNGVSARIFRDLEKRESAEPIEMSGGAESTHLGELMSDRNGRSFASDGSGRRSGMEPGSDPIQRGMQDFAKELLGVLEAHRQKGSLEKLAVFASPKMLGIIRQEMSEGLREALILDKSTNLTNLSDAEVREQLVEALREARLG